MAAAYDMSEAMLAAVGALVEIRGILKFVQGLFSGYEMRCKNGKWVITNENALLSPKDAIPKAYSLWLTCKTLLVHRCWRIFPTLVSKLAEITLGGSFCGVNLGSNKFDEPPPKGTLHPADGGRQDHRKRCIT